MISPLSLAKAQPLAERIAAELQPYCISLAIAGSIRRARPFVNDIDLVVLPKDNDNLESIRRRMRQSQPEVITDSAQTLIIRLRNGVQVDLWIARPESKDLFAAAPTNYGSILLMRTGSKEHNIYLIERAKSLGLTWNPYYGVFDGRGQCLAAATEEDIFAALKLDFTPPVARER
jgi:DNA polymerase (family 10)